MPNPHKTDTTPPHHIQDPNKTHTKHRHIQNPYKTPHRMMIDNVKYLINFILIFHSMIGLSSK